MKLSDVLYKKVLSKSDATVIGEVKDVYFDNSMRNIAYVQIENMQNAMNNFVDFTCFLSVKDALILQDTTPCIDNSQIDVKDLNYAMMGKSVFSTAGDGKGDIVDVEFSSIGKVYRIVTTSATFTPSSIVAIGDVVLLKPTATSKKHVKMPKPEKDYKVELLEDNTVDNLAYSTHPLSSTTQNAPVELANENLFATNNMLANTKEIMPAQPIQNEQNAKQNAPITLASAPSPISLSQNEPMMTKSAWQYLGGDEYQDDAHTPTRVICNTDFLIGRTLTRDLNGYDNSPIAKRGDKIDNLTLSLARKHGKLVELTLLSTN